MPKKTQNIWSQKRVQNHTEYILLMYFVTHPFFFFILGLLSTICKLLRKNVIRKENDIQKLSIFTTYFSKLYLAIVCERDSQLNWVIYCALKKKKLLACLLNTHWQLSMWAWVLSRINAVHLPTNVQFSCSVERKV